MRSLTPLIALCACGATEPAPVQQNVAPPTPVVVASSVPRDASAVDDESEVDPNRVLRGQLIHTREVYRTLGLDTWAAQCIGGDAGACHASFFVDAQTKLSDALTDANAFASTHANALPAEVTCLTALIERTNRFAAVLKAAHSPIAERAAVQTQVAQCDEAFAPTIAKYGVPLPSLIAADAGVYGHLPPATIQRIVRASFGGFKRCYIRGLVRDPTLEGRVESEFIIDRDGSVADSRLHASTVDDAEVNRCIVRHFAHLTFPPAESGIVTVVYPLIFAPGNESASSQDAGASSGLSSVVITNVVGAHTAAIRACYTAQLASHAGLKGEIVVAWTADAGGVVTNTSIARTTMNDAKVEACLLREIATWHFSAGPMNVQYPFKFGL